MKYLCMIMCVILIIGCNKDDTLVVKNTLQKDQLSLGVIQKNSVNYAGYVSSESPVPGTWFIKPLYEQQYVHFWQMSAKPEYPGGVLCGPTSYLLAAHMIATAKGWPYPSSKTKVGAIYTKLSQAGKFDNTLGMYINDIHWFSSTYDFPVIKTSYSRTLLRSLCKEYIEYYLKTGYPVIVSININGANSILWINDNGVDEKSGSSYYISKSGLTGHFILLTGIRINADGTGTVWYKDPLSQYGETRSVYYSRLLDAMKANGNPDYYDAVAVFD